MAKRKLRKGIIWLVVIILILGGSAAGVYRMLPEPPFHPVDSARNALAEARKHHAEIYAEDVFGEANNYFDSAMAIWKKENERFILARDYTRVVSFANLSVQKSAESIEKTRSYSSSLEQKIKQKINTLEGLLQTVSSTITRFPLPKEINTGITKGKLSFREALIQYRQKKYPEADKKLIEAESQLKSAHDKAMRIIENYFDNHRHWKTWMDQTIAESRQQKITAILVDKFAGKCYVYKNGVRTVEFDAELGKNWIGDKRQKGDNTTPEGRYRVTKKKEGRATIYYKALLIDYPNDEDKKRFHAAIADGSLPRNSKIGGLIEIHGHGGKGADWTQGCVALDNSDMDKIYKMVTVGTPVTIIGSIAPLEDILKN